MGSTEGKAAKGVLLPDVPKITRRSIGALCDENHVAKGATHALGMDKDNFFITQLKF